MHITLSIIFFLLGAGASWLITHKYYEKSTKENVDLINQLPEELKKKNTLKYLEVLLNRSKWKKEDIDFKYVWIAEDDNTYQIQIGDIGDKFEEPWITIYPDRNAHKYSVYLKIDNSIIKELDFISLNGGKLFVPMPDEIFEENDIKYLWNLNSLEARVSNIVGEYYIYENLKKVAIRSRIKIVE